MPINASQRKIYESFQMLNENEEFMCYVNEKRANWYVKKGLATWVREKAFKLNFTPNGDGKKDIVYYTQSLLNRCVVCGEEDEKKLNKHHVVPYVFRSRFPIEYKESNHHDIVVTCIKCHDNYERFAMIYKNELAKKYNAQMNYPLSKEEKFNKKILSARNVINKLEAGELVDKEGNILIPEERLIKLKELANKDLLKINEKTDLFWADKIISSLKTEEDLFNFIKDWREHFIKYSKPKYLPEYWSVNHPLEKKNIH